ncbi:hypothetical protein HF086_009536 [Spodoptera exigua]|uniref:THAP-type domain-containing protein n=1 Tax=Spodoptera exigua TaxID=7107 RepID=A0A922MEQ8_SPOEX|nr:hypothetical protein HF086_009536 [Spodoptera exigua]
MNEPSYKYCSVPLCDNTTLKNPEKLFVHVPKLKLLRKKWLNLARRDPKMTSDKSTLYFCEDHFNLPEDMENYTEYRVMGSVKRVRLKPNCVPTKFSCQPDILQRTTPSPTRFVAVKRQRWSLIEEAAVTSDSMDIPTTSAASNIETTSSHSTAEQTHHSEVKFKNQSTLVYPDIDNKLVQALTWSEYRKANTINALDPCIHAPSRHA